MSRSSRAALREAGPALALGAILVTAWFAAAASVASLPSPEETVAALTDLARSGELWAIAWKTTAFLVATSVISALVGVPWGIAAAQWSWLDRSTSPYLFAARALPSGLWIPVVAVLVGATAGSAIVVVTGIVVIAGALPAMVLATKHAVGAIPPLLLRAGRTFGAGRRDLMRRVIVPGAFPGILSGLELGWSMGFRALVAAEIFFGPVGGTGIGSVITESRETGDLAPMLATIVVILVVGMAMDRAVFGLAHERMRRRRGLVDAR